VPYANGVHYDSEEQRRPPLHTLISERVLPAAYATDDGAGVLYRGTDFVEAVAENDTAGAYFVETRGWHSDRDATRYTEALRMDGVRLRPATADDFEFFFDLHKRSLGPYVDQVWGWDDDDQRAYLERNIAPEHTQVIVVDGVDIGRLNVEDHDDEVFLGLIEITPDYQGRGIGAQLIQTLLDDAFAQDKRVRLNVLQVNSRAYQLYRRLGFTEVIREGVAPEIRIRMQAQPPRLP
jgi:ribosomal protein S18 acetylase RimI-like enzyme